MKDREFEMLVPTLLPKAGVRGVIGDCAIYWYFGVGYHQGCRLFINTNFLSQHEGSRNLDNLTQDFASLGLLRV